MAASRIAMDANVLLEKRISHVRVDNRALVGCRDACDEGIMRDLTKDQFRELTRRVQGTGVVIQVLIEACRIAREQCSIHGTGNRRGTGL